MGQLPNVGFENWTTNSIYNYTVDWGCSNQAEWMGVESMTKSTDAFIGSYSAELKSLTVNSNNAFGYIYLGGVGGGPTPTYSYNPTFNTLKFNYKANMLSSDLYVVVIRSLFGFQSAPEIIPANVTTTGTWTEATVAIPPGTQDQLFFGLVMGDPFNSDFPADGSWVKVDNIRLFDGVTPTTALPDYSLENWNVFTNESADGWYDLNAIQSSLVTPSVTKTTDAHSGNYAVRMVNKISSLSGDTTISLLGLTPFDGTNPAIPYPGAIPTTFSGWYKYSSSNLDTAIIQIVFYEAGAAVGFGVLELTDQAAYTQFTNSLIIFGVPDSIQVNVITGSLANSVLYLDDFSLSGGNVSVNEMSLIKTAIYPNPANNEINVYSDSEFDFEIMNALGQIMLKQINNSELQKVSLVDLPAGTYFMKIQSNNSTEIKSLLKTKNSSI
jgi:hypothetical protein